ncbi:dual specificity protein phosphatase family protein [candidate division KSB1 bacterium]|nr:dual specificity protein phosphatase family protein [candidate division KSB1 bacterium]
MKLSEFFDRLLNRDVTGIFRRIPLNVTGRLYVSPMPFGAYDPGNRLLGVYKKNNIDHVFVLVTDAELEKKAKRNLFKQYEKAGITFSRYVIRDFQAPSIDVIANLVDEAKQRLADQRVAVHCHAGVGRTAVAVCSIVVAIERMSVDDTIQFVKKNMLVNITTEQINLIRKFADSIEKLSLKDEL